MVIQACYFRSGYFPAYPVRHRETVVPELRATYPGFFPGLVALNSGIHPDPGPMSKKGDNEC